MNRSAVPWMRPFVAAVALTTLCLTDVARAAEGVAKKTAASAPKASVRMKDAPDRAPGRSSDRLKVSENSRENPVPSDARTRAPKRASEMNDGMLPPAEEYDDLPDAELSDVAAWLDPEKAPELRRQIEDLARRRRAAWPKFTPIRSERADSLGIRVIQSGRVTFHTDVPSSKEVDDIPAALEAAIAPLTRALNLPADRFDDIKIDAFLMDEPDRFVKYGALDGPPKFLYGYSYGDRLYAKNQKEDYYNRFLLTHELVHTLMHEAFGDLRPRWFSEGAAEYLALHNWNSKTKVIEIAQIPASENATPGFGRLQMIKKTVATGSAPSIRDIMNFQPRDFVNVSSYAWSWALVMFLNNSPKYREIAAVMPCWMTADDPNGMFAEAIGNRWDELEYDWADFIARIDWEYDFERTALDFSLELTDESREFPVVTEIDPCKGWQNTGVSLKQGKKYRIAAAGRFDFWLPVAKKSLSFEAPGSTSQYIEGRPAGRLLVAVIPPVAGATFSEWYGNGSGQDTHTGFRFRAFENGAGDRDALYPWGYPYEFASSSLSIEPETDGELWLRINAAPKDLKRNGGTVKIQIKTVD